MCIWRRSSKRTDQDASFDNRTAGLKSPPFLCALDGGAPTRRWKSSTRPAWASVSGRQRRGAARGDYSAKYARDRFALLRYSITLRRIQRITRKRRVLTPSDGIWSAWSCELQILPPKAYTSHFRQLIIACRIKVWSLQSNNEMVMHFLIGLLSTAALLRAQARHCQTCAKQSGNRTPDIKPQ